MILSGIQFEFTRRGGLQLGQKNSGIHGDGGNVTATCLSCTNRNTYFGEFSVFLKAPKALQVGLEQNAKQFADRASEI